MTTTKDYQALYEFLDQRFQYWKTVTKDIADHIMPGYGTFIDRGEPDDAVNVFRSDNILDDSAVRALRIMGAGMQGGLCSHSRRWFRLKMEDEALNEYRPVKQWLEEVEKIMYKIYKTSNFYTSSHALFEMEGGFGTACMVQEERFGEDYAPVRFRLFDAGEFRLMLGADYEVNGFARKLNCTAKQLAERFGKDRLTSKTAKLLDKPDTQHHYVEIYHIVRPNGDKNPAYLDNRNMSYESVWFEANAADDEFLGKSGFDDKPFVAPRWVAPGGSAYGMSPSHTIIGSVKMLQEFCRGGVMAVAREVNPPLNVPPGFKDVISLLPGALNFASEEAAGNKIEPILNVRANLAGLANLMERTVQSIERGFFNHLFLMILNAEHPTREMTATEILKRNEEKLLLLGPTLERQFTEYLDPTIERTFDIGFKRGLFPPPPLEVKGQSWDIEYVSVLAQAQRLSDAQTLQAYRMEAVEVAQIDPMSLTKTDFDKYLDEYADILGIPPDVVRPEMESNKLRQAQAQAMQKEQEQMQMAQDAATAKQLGDTSTESGSALGELIQTARGG